MKVRMVVDQSGTRNGQPWPPRGTVIDLPDDEAIGYVRGGMAVPAEVFAAPEVAVAEDPAVESRGLTTENGPVKRGPGRPRKAQPEPAQ